jgi:hypothetical protein
MAAKLLPILLPPPPLHHHSTATPPPDNYTFATAASIQVGQGSTIIDSGATSHFFPDCAKFITLEAIKAQDVRMADRTCDNASSNETMIDDNLYTTQTLECSKGKYNVKIRKQKFLLRSHQQPM